MTELEVVTELMAALVAAELVEVDDDLCHLMTRMSSMTCR